MSDIQAVIFEKRYYTPTTARKWLKRNGLTPIKAVDKTKNYLRYRIRIPAYKSYYTYTVPENRAVKFVIGVK